jgi:phage/plasmid-like protein (TIGR03299 family)
MQHLNLNTLIGMTDKRGKAWHYREGLQGDEPNHYPAYIPAADVKRRLFGFDLAPARVAVEVPADVDTMTHVSDAGMPVRWAVQDDRKAVIRTDTTAALGIFSADYVIHPYTEWLIGVTSNILGDTLGITSAGLLKGGAVAWVEISVPETLHMPDTGVSYRPNILTGTSCDGSVATFYKRTIQNTVCDNTMAAAMREIGQEYRVKHTAKSAVRVDDARRALNIITQTSEVFEDHVRALTRTTVTDRQWFKFLDTYVPLTKDGEKLAGRSLTMATTKQDTLRRLWIRDPRVSPWQGTAWGVLQAVNTYTHHEGIVRGASRDERNMLNAISGQTFRTDDEALATLQAVLANA